MTTYAPYDALRRRLETNWTTTPIGWVSENFKPPNPPVAFIMADVISMPTNQITIGAPGNNLFREVGALSIAVYYPANKGTDVPRQYATTLASLFRAVDFEGVSCKSPTIQRGQMDDTEGIWYRIDVFCPFHYDLYA